MRHTVTVVGAVNVDIGGKPSGPLKQRDSNPGTVSISPGGVGRNIAHNLALLGNHVRLITALGEDPYAARLVEDCERHGIDISQSFRFADAQTSTYLFIVRDDGDMELAISDMQIYERMLIDDLSQKLPVIRDSDLLILDTNIPEEAIRFLTEHVELPIFAEPVSMTKAEKLKGVLPRLTLVTPNYLEAGVLGDCTVFSGDLTTMRAAADRILAQGTQHVVITAGSEGAYIKNREMEALFPPIPGRMVNGNGCGDALMAGLATAFLEGYDPAESLRIGMAAATCTLETEKTNNDEMTWEMIKTRASV